MDSSGLENLTRHKNVRSVTIPSTQGMVRLDDVVEILQENDDVPAHAVYNVREAIDDDPSTGGHVAINSPSRSAHTADFERLDIYAPLEHDARGTFVGAEKSAWLKATISRELDERLDEAARGYAVDGLRDQIVTDALEAYLGDAVFVEGASDDELVTELQERGYTVSYEGGDEE